MTTIKLGTIGSGVIVHSILDNVKRTPGIQLEAVYSRTEEKGRKLAEAYGARKVYTELSDMLSNPEINFVYVASPNLLHYSQTKAALLAGKNVICEKPFCPRLEQARELVELARERKLFLIDAVPTSFLPNLELMKQQLPKIGKIKLVQANYSQYSSRYDLLLQGQLPNIFNPDYAGGCLMDINFYNVYLNVALFGPPRQAVYYPNCYPGAADTSGVMVMQYDGFVSESCGAKDTWGVNFFQIEGEKGYIYVKDGSNGLAEFSVVTKTGQETFNAQPEPDRWFYEVQKVTELVREENYEAILDRQQVMLAVMEVLETGRKQTGIFFPGDPERV